MTCYVIRAGVAGLCKCGKDFEGDCHFLKLGGVPFDLSCGECCEVHAPKLTPWPATVETIRGEQLELA